MHGEIKDVNIWKKWHLHIDKASYITKITGRSRPISIMEMTLRGAEFLVGSAQE